MNDEQHADAVLFALFQLSRETCHISAATLAAAANSTPTGAARTLVALEAAGLVDATRARLTMAGLIAASRLQASGSGGPALDLEAARRASPAQASPDAPARVPVAARSVPPPPPPPRPAQLPSPVASRFLDLAQLGR